MNSAHESPSNFSSIWNVMNIYIISSLVLATWVKLWFKLLISRWRAHNIWHVPAFSSIRISISPLVFMAISIRKSSCLWRHNPADKSFKLTSYIKSLGYLSSLEDGENSQPFQMLHLLLIQLRPIIGGFQCMGGTIAEQINQLPQPFRNSINLWMFHQLRVLKDSRVLTLLNDVWL